MIASQKFDLSGSQRSLLKWSIAGGIVLASAFFLRHVVIEPHAMGALCRSDQVPWWCDLREGIIFMHARMIWGYVGLAAGLVALWTKLRIAIWLGFTMSLMGLVLYNANFAAIGLVLTFLALSRR